MTANQGGRFLTSNVVNKPDFLLPETGGMGTIVLYCAAGAVW